MRARAGARTARTALPLAMCLLLAGCAGGIETCGPGAQRMLVAELLFGRNVGDRLGVSEQAFRRFVDEELTPRFPDGLTLLDASGQYRSSGGIVKEPSKVAMIAVVDTPEARAKLTEAADAYKRRFRQESVGIVLKPACVSF